MTMALPPPATIHIVTPNRSVTRGEGRSHYARHPAGKRYEYNCMQCGSGSRMHPWQVAQVDFMTLVYSSDSYRGRFLLRVRRGSRVAWSPGVRAGRPHLKRLMGTSRYEVELLPEVRALRSRR